MYPLIALAATLALSASAVAGQDTIHQYVIERDLPGAGELSAEELQDISARSRDILEALGPEIRWQHSYVTKDKLYCVYNAPDEAIIRKHAERGGFPVTRISEVATVISPATAGD